jgi:hypothetical protein
MMRSFLATICLFSCVFHVNAQNNYDVSLIPKHLLPYASSVVRTDDLSVVIEDYDNTFVHEKMAVTILNKNGDDMARVVLFYNKSNVIKNVKGLLYDEYGKQIGKFSEGNFEDESAWDGFSLFLDTRVKHYTPAITTYPYTIVYEYDMRLKQSLNLPEWQPNPHFGVAIEKSSFEFSCKPEFHIRYKETNFSGKVETTTGPKGLKTYSWHEDNLKAVKKEPLSPYSGNYLTSVKIAPEKFIYEGLSGTFENWKDLGKWEYDKLVASRQQLPTETMEHIREITKDISDPKLKAKKVYEYMQDKTHYVSVQIGIGGYQPFLASDVDQQNYGDCKALVNYTQALLKAINIESYYCVVEAGENYKVSMMNDFATMEQGNHIILCLPFKNDTTWADCTSQTIPFGYLGGFTDDRTVLACTPEGGKLLHTPKYTADNNRESRKADFIVNENGELSGRMSTMFKGVDYEDRSFLVGETQDEQVKRLKKIYPINNLNIDKVEFKRYKSADPAVTETIQLHARDYASAAGGKLFFMLNSFDRAGRPPPQVQNRVNDVYINRGYTEEDEITYTLPQGYRLEKTPFNYSVNKPFGSFSVSMAVNGDKLIYKRRFKVIDGTYSKETYQDLIDFYQTAYDADEYTVSLVK